MSKDIALPANNLSHKLSSTPAPVGDIAAEGVGLYRVARLGFPEGKTIEGNP